MRLDKESYERGESTSDENAYGVAPLPATSGAFNPVKLAPGEKVPEPSSYTGNTINNNVRLDRETYERGETGAPQLPPVLDQQEEREAAGASMFGLPSVGGTMIPESSLPMGSSTSRDIDMGPTISSAGPQSTTAQLAGQQPIHPRGVPEVVSESQQEAGFSPEAASSTSAVQQKSALEEEIKDTVPEVPAASESGLTGRSEHRDVAGVAAGGLAAAGATAIGAAYMARDKIAEATGSTSATGATTGHASTTAKDPNAILSYEAGASQSEVQQKEALGDELKATIPEAPTTSESGIFGKSEQGIGGAAAGGLAAVGASAAGAAYLARDKIAEATGYTSTSGTTAGATTANDSEAFISHETGASTSEIHQKEAVADELKATIPEAPTTSESGTFGKSEQGLTGALGASATGAAYTARDKLSEATGYPTRSGNNATHDPETFISHETGASTSEIHQKEAVADELKATIPEAPTTSESGTVGKSEKGIADIAAGGLATAGAAAAGAAYMARDKTAEATGRNPNTMLPASVQSAIDSMNGGVKPSSTTTSTTQGNTVPAVVSESQHEAHASPEASASREAVREKSAMEKELLAEVRPSNATGEPAPTPSAALYSSVPTTTSTQASTVPAVVSESQHEAHVSPEASASRDAVREKSAMEKELLAEVRPSNETGEPAPSQSAAQYSSVPTTSVSATSGGPKSALAGASTASTYQPSGLNASATSQAQTPATKIAERATASQVDTVGGAAGTTSTTTGSPSNYLTAGAASSEPRSGDVSPMTMPSTSGVASSTTPAKSEGAPAPIVPGGDSATRTSAIPVTPQGTPQKKQAFKDTPESTRTTTTTGTSDSPSGDKKGKRKSFFGKLKDRFKA